VFVNIAIYFENKSFAVLQFCSFAVLRTCSFGRIPGIIVPEKKNKKVMQSCSPAFVESDLTESEGPVRVG
jgi:hypothetical protein